MYKINFKLRRDKDTTEDNSVAEPVLRDGAVI